MTLMDAAPDRPGMSLEQALRKLGFPMENDEFIRRFTTTLGATSFTPMVSYVKVERPGGRALKIASGYTNGFESEQEIVDALGEVDCWPSKRGWGVWHPVHGGPSSGGGTRRPAVDYGTCPVCFTEYSARGTCLCD